MLGVAVDQVDLLGVRVVHLLLVHLFCHGLVVGLVDVALFPDGNSVEMSLRRADGQEGEGGTGGGKKISKRKTGDQKRQPSSAANLEAQNRTNRFGSGGSAHSKLLGAASFLRGSRRGHHTPRYQAGSSCLPRTPPPGVRANPAVRSAPASALRTPCPRHPAETPAGERTRLPTFLQPLSPPRHPLPELFTVSVPGLHFPSLHNPFRLHP